MMSRIKLQPRNAALFQLLKQRPEPIRMLVINRNGPFESGAVSICLVAHEPSRLALFFGVSLWGGGCPAVLGLPLNGCMRTPRSFIIFPRPQGRTIAPRFFDL